MPQHCPQCGYQCSKQPTARLSARQIEVLEHIARGYKDREIAKALHISNQTVKNHMSAILQRLGARDRTTAVIHALQERWIALPEKSEMYHA